MAFEMLLHRHGHEIMCLTKRILHDSVAVEDAFQETLLRIWRGAVHFRATDEVVAKGWIMKIARNTTLNFLRKEKNLSRREVDVFGRHRQNADNRREIYMWTTCTIESSMKSTSCRRNIRSHSGFDSIRD